MKRVKKGEDFHIPVWIYNEGGHHNRWDGQYPQNYTNRPELCREGMGRYWHLPNRVGYKGEVVVRPRVTGQRRPTQAVKAYIPIREAWDAYGSIHIENIEGRWERPTISYRLVEQFYRFSYFKAGDSLWIWVYT